MKKLKSNDLKNVKGGSRCSRLFGKMATAYYDYDMDRFVRLRDRFDSIGCEYPAQ